MQWLDHFLFVEYNYSCCINFIRFLWSDPDLVLRALNPEISVPEPDEEGYITFQSCFEATISQARKTDAIFDLVLLNSSTATENEDYIFRSDLQNITIPTGFYGNFSYCLNVIVLGDITIEDDEAIEIDIRPQAPRDSVYYAGGDVNTLVFYIIDNDGKKKKIQFMLYHSVMSKLLE